MKNFTLAKSVAVLFASFLAITSLSAQNATSGQWELFKSSDKVDVYKQVSNCTTEQYQMEYWNFKFVNKTNAAVTVNYFAEYMYEGETTCRTCGNEEYRFTVNVPANGSTLAQCNGGNQYDRQAVFIKNTNLPNYANLASFTMGSFSVE